MQRTETDQQCHILYPLGFMRRGHTYASTFGHVHVPTIISGRTQLKLCGGGVGVHYYYCQAAIGFIY